MTLYSSLDVVLSLMFLNLIQFDKLLYSMIVYMKLMEVSEQFFKVFFQSLGIGLVMIKTN